MKKFTLLALASLAFGTAMAQNVLEVQKSAYGAPEADRHYYRMRNMRAMRLNYTNKYILDQDGDSIGYDSGCVTMDSVKLDASGQPVVKETLEDGTVVYETVGMTHGANGNSYMGLSTLNGNWWLSFSGQEEIKDPNTEYWWFEEHNRTEGAVLIHNAVIDGSVSNKAKTATDLAGYSRSNMDFNTKVNNNAYYILPVRPAFESMTDENWVDSILGKGTEPGSLKQSITEEELNSAFALCTHDAITVKGAALYEGSNDTNDGDCLDANNYINFTVRVANIDENGDTVYTNGYPTYYQYGFAGVDRTWTPITTNGSNNNHWVNNGTLFFFEEASADEANAAIEAYKHVIEQGFKDGANENAKAEFSSAIEILKGWQNVPAIWTDSKISALNSILSECENWDGEGLEDALANVKDTDSRDEYVELAAALAEAKLAQAAALVGTGAKVTFKNMLAIRDHADCIEAIADDDVYEYQLGNAYIAAGGDYYYRDSDGMWIFDDSSRSGESIEPKLEKDEYCVWTLIPVTGTKYFLLYNEEDGTYIRKYSDMYAHLDGDVYFDDEPSEITWGTTPNEVEAAPFLLIGCPYDQDPYYNTLWADDTDDWENTELENYLYVIDDPDEQTIENKVRLQAVWEEETKSSTGVVSTTTVTANIHRGTAGSKYKFINYTNTKNTWLADTNAFHVGYEEEGMNSINEVAAAEKAQTTGIYDLQGRKVAKAQKGLYIINGVKTLVK